MSDPDDDTHEYQLAVPFMIDNGELDGLTPQQIFVLGVEFGQAHARAQTGLPFDMRMHAENEERITQALENYMGYEAYQGDNDLRDEGWVHLWFRSTATRPEGTTDA